MSFPLKKWLFVLLAAIALLSALGLTVPSLAEGERTQSIYPAVLAAGVLIPVLLMAVMGWQSTVSTDSSRSRMEFMYKMTHELQTPVSNIILAAGMLDTPAVRDSPDRFDRYARMIREDGMRMQWHIENVLNVAKAESKALQLHPESTLLDEYVESLLVRYGDRVQSTLRAGKALVDIDKQHFTNVLYNLIDNAFKYSQDPPTVRVETDARENAVVLSVQDRGIGIAESEQKKIFANFYRVEDNAASVKGFGLGLSYVQQIAKAHHWRLELDSRQGEGSDFRLVIPRTASEQQAE